MKTRLALIAVSAALLAAAPALGEPGDAPKSPQNYLPADQVAQLEHQRQVQAVGGVTASPYWLKQGYICGRSISLRLYEVEKTMLPRQLLFKERLRFAQDGSGEKELLLTINKETAQVELRIGSDALEMLDRAGIARVIVRTRALETVQVYECADIQAANDYFELEAGETICLQGDDAPLYAYDEDSVRRGLSN